MRERHPPNEVEQQAAEAGDSLVLELQAEVLRALSHPARLHIMEMLRGGERCVCEIGPVLGLRQPNISQHLSILRAANLVATRREGLRVIYRVTDPAVSEVIDLVKGIVRRRGASLAEAVLRADGPR